MLKEHPAKWMVWEGDPMPETVAKLKEYGLDSIAFDPFGNVPGTDDYLSVMRQNILNIKKAFSQ